MSEARDREIFRAGGRPYSWPQVLAGACFRGDAAALGAEEADAIAVLRYAEEERFPLGGDGGEAGGEAFRLEHGLITGEEMERWLDHCGIEFEDFEAHFAGRQLLERFSGTIAEIRRDYAPTADEVVEALWTATLLSGNFEPFARALAARVANRLQAPSAAADNDLTALLKVGGPRVPESLRAPGLLEDLAAMEALYAAAARDAASPGRCAAALRERSYQLARIVVAEALLPTLDQAREAYQAVLADGLAFEDVAEEAGVRAVEKTYVADEAPEGATALLSALPGRVLEPQAVEGGFLLQLLRRRIPADLADPDVAARVRDRLLAAHFDALVSAHVAWSFDPWTMP